MTTITDIPPEILGLITSKLTNDLDLIFLYQAGNAKLNNLLEYGGVTTLRYLLTNNSPSFEFAHRFKKVTSVYIYLVKGKSFIIPKRSGRLPPSVRELYIRDNIKSRSTGCLYIDFKAVLPTEVLVQLDLDCKVGYSGEISLETENLIKLTRGFFLGCRLA